VPEIIDLIYAPFDSDWGKTARAVLSEFSKDRYGSRWEKKLQVRVNGDPSDEGAPYAALIPAGQPTSGPYGGMSFVLFPAKDHPALVSLVIGTNGLSPDERALGLPGHARKAAAIVSWLNHSIHKQVAWAKRDPVRIDLGLPPQIKEWLIDYENAIEKYEKVIYAVFLPFNKRENDDLSIRAANTLIDILAEERGLQPLAKYKEEKEIALNEWLKYVLPSISPESVEDLLHQRRYVILEGPPGTGKTRLADELLKEKYKGNGKTIQFHPGTTYESFIGGLAPQSIQSKEIGLSFFAKPGHLMEAVELANRNPKKDYLLHIDEINRADLAKVLGEAIYLFEPNNPDREVDLAHDFGEPFGTKLKLPTNLYVLGTMNSADRSIAILDIAVRRRFAFTTLWPEYAVLESTNSSDRMKEAFKRLFSIFLEEAGEDAFSLMPGHAYFLDYGKKADQLLQTGLKPLLNEYLIQGYVSGFADSIRAYLDWLNASAL
jgi:5-methylcytosine-specific restriction enzyme B